MTSPLPQPGIADIAAARAQTWRLLDELAAEPTMASVERLRHGRWLADLRRSTGWLEDAAAPMTRAAAALEVLPRRAARRTAVQDLDELGAAWRGPVADWSVHRPEVMEVVLLCDDESQAWATGDLGTAKARRVAETDVIERALVPNLPAWADRVDVPTGSPTYRSLARLVIAWLSVESGRDFTVAHAVP